MLGDYALVRLDFKASFCRPFLFVQCISLVGCLQVVYGKFTLFVVYFEEVHPWMFELNISRGSPFLGTSNFIKREKWCMCVHEYAMI